MSATNLTTYYRFPIFVGSDKPAWLVDWNGAMTALDTAIHEAKAEADANATDIATLQSSVLSLSGSVESQGSSIITLTQSLTALQGTVNTITSLIGNGEPTTQDKTIIGAINELKADIDALDPSGEGVQAENVSYDNTDSGLTADDVQSAIDEIQAEIDALPSGATVEIQRGTLTAGQTSVALQFSATVGATDLVDIYTDAYGVNPTAITVSGDTITLTFATQASNVAVAVKVQK